MASPESKARIIGRAPRAQESNAGFYLVLAYVFFEFGRPQELVPGLTIIPFGTGLSILILFKVLASRKLDFSRVQTRLWLFLLAVMAVHVPIAVNNYWALITLKDMILLYFVYLGIVTFVDSLDKMMTLIKLWLAEAERMAFTATLRLPSTLFLNPTADEMPLASFRCVGDSVVRAPIAVQLTRS